MRHGDVSRVPRPEASLGHAPAEVQVLDVHEPPFAVRPVPHQASPHHVNGPNGPVHGRVQLCRESVCHEQAALEPARNQAARRQHGGQPVKPREAVGGGLGTAVGKDQPWSNDCDVWMFEEAFDETAQGAVGRVRVGVERDEDLRARARQGAVHTRGVADIRISAADLDAVAACEVGRSVPRRVVPDHHLCLQPGERGRQRPQTMVQQIGCPVGHDADPHPGHDTRCR